jgi:hypothetical protein
VWCCMLHTEQLMLRDSDGGCLSLSFSVRIECGDRVWEELDRLCTEHVKRVGETVLFYFQSGEASEEFWRFRRAWDIVKVVAS